jgi:hypothetical protein
MSKTGYIYKIYSKDNKLVYYGSTSQKYVSSRMSNHNADYKRWKNGNINFTSSYLIIDTGDWDYMVCEKMVFDEPFELKNRERWYIENNACVNKVIPNRSQKEYNKANAEEIKEYKKKYREQNREELNKKQKEYYEENKEELNKKQNEKVKCECGCIVSYSHLSRHKKSKKHLKLLDAKTLN